jgi:hypothetical protein
MVALTVKGTQTLLRGCFVPFANIPFVAGGERVGEVVADMAVRQGDIGLLVQRQFKRLLDHILLSLLVEV